MSKQVGDYRLIPKYTQVFSISNQMNIILTEDIICQIQNKFYNDENAAFVKPMQKIFDLPGFFPAIIGKGTDEYSIDLTKTAFYEEPDPLKNF